MKVALDIDGVLADFGPHFFDYLGIEDKTPAKFWDDPRFKDNMHLINHDAEFWLGIPPMVTPEELEFVPYAYVTAREIDTYITRTWLKFNRFPDVHVETVGIGGSKVQFLKEINPDYYIDDAIHNYEELNSAGINTLLMTRSHNEGYDAGDKRIASFSDFKERFIYARV